mgnify:CR=1 FL=1
MVIDNGDTEKTTKPSTATATLSTTMTVVDLSEFGLIPESDSLIDSIHTRLQHTLHRLQHRHIQVLLMKARVLRDLALFRPALALLTSPGEGWGNENIDNCIRFYGNSTTTNININTTTTTAAIITTTDRSHADNTNKTNKTVL